MAIKSEAAKEKKRVARRKYNAQPKNIAKRSRNKQAREAMGMSKGNGKVANHVKGNTKSSPLSVHTKKQSASQGGKKISRNKAHMKKIGARGGRSKG